MTQPVNNPPPSRSRLRATPRTPWRTALALCAALTSSTLLADSIKLGGFWINDVTIQGVDGDSIRYTNSLDAEVVTPLAEVEGLKMTAYPDVAVAQDALDKKNDDAAARALTLVITKSREPWLKQWASFHRVQALDRQGKAVEAAQAYVELVRLRPSAYYLSAPPIKSVQSAPVAQQVDIRKRLEPVATRDDVPGVKQLLDLVKNAQEAAPAAAPAAPAAVVVPTPTPPSTPVAPTPTTPAATPTPAEPPAPAAPAPDPAATTSAQAGPAMPSGLENDAVTALLRAGKYAEALAECDRLLAMKELRLAMRLYQRGMAQLQLADAASDDKLYRDAALSFMRVAIYFPRSEYAGAAMMEAGYAHQKFGRPDIAANLWQKAQLLIDAETEPALAARLQSLVAGNGQPQG